jgi:hypothetical protein
MTTTVVYVGSSDSVYVPALGQVVLAGEPCDVDDDLAAALLDQPANWAVAATHSAAAPESTDNPPDPPRRTRNAPRGTRTRPEPTGQEA